VSRRATLEVEGVVVAVGVAEARACGVSVGPEAGAGEFGPVPEVVGLGELDREGGIGGVVRLVGHGEAVGPLADGGVEDPLVLALNHHLGLPALEIAGAEGGDVTPAIGLEARGEHVEGVVVDDGRGEAVPLGEARELLARGGVLEEQVVVLPHAARPRPDALQVAEPALPEDG